MAPANYADALRQAIADSDTSRRKLSADLAARTGNQQPSEYRRLGKYLAGDEMPSRATAAELAVLLRRPELALVPEIADRRRDRREAAAAEAAALRDSVTLLLEVSSVLAGEVARLGGSVPQETLDALRRAVAGRQP